MTDHDHDTGNCDNCGLPRDKHVNGRCPVPRQLPSADALWNTAAGTGVQVKIATGAGHTTWLGFQDVRCRDGSSGLLPYAGCHCQWEGPGRFSRSRVVEDGFMHLAQAVQS